MSLDARLQTIFRDVFDDDSLVLTEELSQQTWPEWDSFHQVKLVISVQEEFGVAFTTEEALSLTSVATLKTALRGKAVAAG